LSSGVVNFLYSVPLECGIGEEWCDAPSVGCVFITSNFAIAASPFGKTTLRILVVADFVSAALVAAYLPQLVSKFSTVKSPGILISPAPLCESRRMVFGIDDIEISFLVVTLQRPNLKNKIKTVSRMWNYGRRI